MKIRRTIPPAAPPLYFRDLFSGLAALVAGSKRIGKLEKEVGEYFGVRHVFFVSSGKAAFFVILEALKSLSPEKKEVVIPAYTCFSVPSVIVKAGLEISPCDLNADFDYDFKMLEEVCNDGTLCIISSHLFGIPSDVERIKSICKDKGIFVVEDAAQAMGVADKGHKLGTMGDAAFFSLGRGKNITCGEGGFIVTNSGRISKAITGIYSSLEAPDFWSDVKELSKLTAMKLFINPSTYWLPSGLPFLKLGETVYHKDFPVKRLSVMKAGIMKRWRTRLEKINEIRKENTEYYCKNLRKPSCVTSTPCIRMPFLTRNGLVREKILSAAHDKGLGISKMYPSPVNEIKEIKDRFNGKDYPLARVFSERLLTLPTHHYLRERDRMEICNLIKNGEEETIQ